MARQRVYRKVETSLWTDEVIRKLSKPKPNAHTLWLYLLTGQRTTIIPGVVVARPAVMADDLGWSRRALGEKLAEIVSAGLAEVDSEAGLVVLSKALIHDDTARETSKPNTPNTIKSWARSLLDVPGCALKERLVDTVARFAELCGPEMSNAFRSGVPRLKRETTVESPPTKQVTLAPQDTGEETGTGERRVPAPRALDLPPHLKPFRSEASRLWDLQESLRRQVCPTVRGLAPTADRIARIAKLRHGGRSVEELEACLRFYAAEASRKPESMQWFDGESNWRPANVDRALHRGSSSPGLFPSEPERTAL